jgi:nucleotide-binding universal stress UspA family protein
MGTVVVGVDGSEASLAALRFALDEARARGAALVALHAWQLPLTEAPGPFLLELPELAGPTVAEVADRLEEAAAHVLDRALEEVAGPSPGVPIERRVVERAPAPALLAAAADADLLVVGTRGHGGFAGLRLGSVAAHCASHSPCPVVVVPAGRP